MHERAVRDPIGGGDFDVLLGDGLRIRRPRQEHREPGPRRKCAELASRDTGGRAPDER